MRNAPSVIYPVGRCVFYARALIVLGLLGLVVQVLWWADAIQRHGIEGVSGTARWTGLAGFLLWLLWVGFASHSWRRAPEGRLQWDALAAGNDGVAGAGIWRWRSQAYQSGSPLQRVETLLDLQSRVLVRLTNSDGAGSWIWTERGRDPAQWNALRRALLAGRR